MRTQFFTLIGITLIHFFVDMFGGLMPAILPILRQEFGISLTAGVALLTILNLMTNGIQLYSGGLRHDRHEPFFLAAGMVLAATIALVPFAPQYPNAMVWLALIMAIGGIGIGVVHPEALRAVHVLGRIPSSLSTAFFMVGGYLGFAGGAYVASLLVERWGLKGLSALLLCPVLGLGVLALSKIRLAVEDPGAGESESDPAVPRMAFGHLMIMAIPICTASTIIPGLLPTYLYAEGMPLSFGGASVLMFGIGGAIGGLAWGAAAHRIGYLRSMVLSLLLGVPLLLVYFSGHGQGHLALLLALAGFCVYASYPMIVTMARYARGPKLGRRMGFIVGGVWGLASLIFMSLGPVAERHGVGAVLRFTWIGYLIPAVYGLVLMRKVPTARATANSKAASGLV